VLPVDKSVGRLRARDLLLHMLSQALTFAAQNAGNFAERALLATDTAAIAALGLGWYSFNILQAFAGNLVGVCQLVVGRRTGEGDESGARAAGRQALLLAGCGGALGLAVAAASGAAAGGAAGPARGAALFLATQGLALGPLLAAQALTGYFAGTMRCGARWLAAVSFLPSVVHLALVWLLTGLLSWSVAGAGLARLVAALAAVAAAVAVARAHFACTRLGARACGSPSRRGDRALLWTMLREGSVLGVQQVVVGLMVLVLYLGAAGAGDVTSAALTLTHAGVYPLLFCLAWGASQAVSAAAAQAVGRGDARELARITRLGLGISAPLAFALPWGVYALCGGPTLAWLVQGSPEAGALRTACGRFMGLLAVFFVFDFAINFLSALLKAAGEHGYLLTATAAAAAGFGLLVLALPSPRPATWLLGAFIAAQAAWAVLLLVGVVRRWPGTAVTSGPPLCSVRIESKGKEGATPRGREQGAVAPGQDWLYDRKFPTAEHHAMDPIQPMTGLLPAALRALALGLLVETAGNGVTHTLNGSREKGPVPPGPGGADGKAELWQALRGKCSELSALVLGADDPREAAAYVLGYLPKHLDYVFELIQGQKRLWAVDPRQ
jgi:Na+-driven multidrug efflux pump